MVTLSINDNKLVAEVEGWHKVWACKSRLEIPLEHVTAATARPEDAATWWHGWKMVGTDFPGEFAAGLFRTGGKWVFWDVRQPENTIRVDLRDEKYSELLLEVQDPDAAVALIESALAKA